MKTTKIFLYLLLALPMLLLQSCLKDDKEVFDKPSSQRMEEYLQQAKEALVSAPNGWALAYYPEKNQSYGGFSYTVKFDNDRAQVAFELAGTDTETTLYKLKSDDGPVLSFDTYNVFMHYFSTPASGLYQGYEGDFEFVIDSIGADKIKLHGKKTLNTMYLTKLTESPESYMEKVIENGDAQINTYVRNLVGKIGNADFRGTIVNDDRLLSYFNPVDSVEETVAFAYTDKNISFYKPITFGGQTLTALTFDAATLSFTGTTTSGEKVTLQGSLPPNFRKPSFYIGDYTLYYNKGQNKGNVSIKSDGRGGLVLAGLLRQHDIALTFDKGTGDLYLNTQQLATVDGNNIYLCAWSLQNGGSLTIDTQYGVQFVWNGDKEHPEYTFADNGAGFGTDSFIFYMIGANTGLVTYPEWLIAGTSARLPYLQKLVKK